jgi:hypothetical protein
MADDSLFVTRRLQRIAEATTEELEASGDTIVLDETDAMETKELKRLLKTGTLDGGDDAG